ncbi:hypothetical protein V5F72_21435 [Xanthobacter flavus]|uniref:hypothetical protein n=1 Tax=Xanthobacter flavus TaxID=281 RepID=UPI00372AD53E
MLSRQALVIALIACASGVASAETPSFCNQYASKAIHDVQLVRSNPKCNAGNLHGGVFSTDYNVHYSWCLRVDANRAYAGTSEREAYLKKCTASNPGPAVQNPGNQPLTAACISVYSQYLKGKGPKAFALSSDRKHCGASWAKNNVQSASARAIQICVTTSGGTCKIQESSNR